jgi:hypothetical protein
VAEALTWVEHGQVTIGSLIAAVKPSELTKIQPQPTAVRRLTITTTIPLTTTGETETELIVPAGLTFTTADPLLSVTKLEVNGNLTATEAFLARITDLTVSGSLTAVKATYSKVTKLTVNSAFNIGSVSLPALEDLIVNNGGAFITTGSIGTVASENGVGLEIAPKGSASVGAINSLRTSTIQGSLTASAFTLYAPSPLPTPAPQLMVAAGGSINGITFPGVVVVTVLSNVNSVTIDDFTLPEDQGFVIPATKSLVIGAGKTFTYDGQVTIGASGNLVLATDTGSVAKIAGKGSITTGVAATGTTTIKGAWEAAGTGTGSLTILGAATGATITATASATGLKASTAGAAITQAAGTGNSLSIGTSTAITLGGTNTVPLGTIILKSAAANPAKLAFIATSSKVEVGAGTGGTAITGLTGLAIGGKTLVNGSLVAADFQNASGVLVLLGGTTVGNFTASTVANADVLIDSTVAASGT